MRTATHITKIEGSLEVMARVQLARRNLKYAYIDITSFSDCADEEFMGDYSNMQTKMSNNMHKFILALKNERKGFKLVADKKGKL